MDLEIIRKYGGAASDAILDPACSIFKVDDIEGLIGYKETKKCLVSIGDPVAKNENKIKLAIAFEEFCKQKNKSSLYFIASQDFLDQSFNKITHAYINFGNELFINPSINPKKSTGQHACLIRRKLKHAEKEGVKVFEYKGQDLKLEQKIEEVADKWLKARKGFQTYISHVRLFEDRCGKRWFYAVFKDEVIGVLVLNEFSDNEGWHLNHLMTIPRPPGGTPESLVQKAIDTLEEERCHYLSFGQSPKLQPSAIEGFGMITTFLLKLAFTLAVKFTGLDTHGGFWDKFDPQSKPSYLLFTDQKIKIRDIFGLLKAMNFELK